MVQTSVKPITFEEFLELPETKPASEYIDGKIIQKPMPKGRHSIIQTELSAAINANLEESKAVATGFHRAEMYLWRGRSIVPDIAVFETPRIPKTESGEINDIFSIAPDWTIEILSPEQRPTKVLKNIAHCLLYGTQMGWLIDPDERSILVCQPGQSLIVLDETDQALPVPQFASALQLTLGTVFDWLRSN